MRIVVFNGSPRGRDSNSHQIVEPLLEGAKEAGARTEEVFLVEKDIRHCRGCFHCWTRTPGRCVIDDDMGELIEQFLESDYAGMATPVYGMYMTGLLKNFSDRMLPLATPHIRRNEDGTFYHEGRVLRFPRRFFIANSGFPGEHNFDVLRAFWSLVRSRDPDGVVLEVYRNCGEALQAREEDHPELFLRLARFRESLRVAGAEMVRDGSVSEETVEALHLRLMSDDEYMAAANEEWDEQIKGEAPPSAPDI